MEVDAILSNFNFRPRKGEGAEKRGTLLRRGRGSTYCYDTKE